MPKKLTDKTIKGLKGPAKGYAIRWDTDVHGFGIRVTAAGSKNFVFNYRTRGGKLRRLTIGEFPAYSTEAARKVAVDHRHAVGNGGDPVAHRQSERDAPTFKDLCDYYVERHLPTKRPSSALTDRYTIDKVLMPKLGKLKVADITANDIDGIHYRITKAGHPYRANRVLAQLAKMFALAVRPKGWRSDNPAKGIARNPESKRERYLSSDELTRLSEALAAHRDQDAANAIRLLLLTGARRGEVLSATWDQVDFEQGTWTKPSSHTKQKAVHTVPLSPPALELLSAMYAADSPYLFPGRVAHRTDLKKPWAAICEAAGIAGLRLHDLRHSFASIAVSGGASLPMIGSLLGHTRVETTARYAHLQVDPVREVTTRVGAVIKGAGTPGADVVKLKPRRNGG